MLQDIIVVGDKLDVKQLDQAGGQIKSAKTYVSQLLDIADEQTISIAMPHGNGNIFILEQENNYQLMFYTSKGLYQCNSVMLKAYRENNAIIALLKLTSKLEKFQRRQYYRLECIHDIEYHPVAPEEIALEERLELNQYANSEEKAEIRRKLSQLNKVWYKASITDLSGGGAKFNSEETLDAGSRIRIKLDFITGGILKKLQIGAEIIASQKLMNHSGKYENRVEFIEIGKNDREDLIKYIFEQDRNRRRNGKV